MKSAENKSLDSFFTSKTLLELADNLEVFLEYASLNNNDNNLYERYYRELMFYKPRATPFKIFKEDNIAFPYLLTNWALHERGEDNYKNINDIIKTTREIFFPSSDPVIQEERILEMMKLVDSKYGYCSKVLREKPLDIIINEEGCKKGNSLFMTLDINGLINNDLIICSCVQEQIYPEYAFLHEAGHVLHLRLTQKYQGYVPPKSFDFIQQAMFKPLANRPKSEWAECFAECFAIAALYGTEYAHYDYATFISDHNKLLIATYIQVLMDTYEDNILGELSWNELRSIYIEKHKK
ncbi:MAG: hypothetical protein LBS36_13135 [Oscillospiraceae bacterium]|jgi:hypothetical protein|nr:hypothetical protein [Oscillospiraceae bacterium]